MRTTLDKFTEAYLECALWSSTDNSNEQGGDPLDDNYGIDDLSPKALQSAIDDCKCFQDDNCADIEATGAGDAQSGHDFWLTRNRHGAGFWDRGYEKSLGNRLTDAAHAWGSCDIYVGDDGQLHI